MTQSPIPAETRPDLARMRPYELMKEADRLLRKHGLDIKGREKHERDSKQDSFEYGMRTGAYSSNGSKRRA